MLRTSHNFTNTNASSIQIAKARLAQVDDVELAEVVTEQDYTARRMRAVKCGKSRNGGGSGEMEAGSRLRVFDLAKDRTRGGEVLVFERVCAFVVSIYQSLIHPTLPPRVSIKSCEYARALGCRSMVMRHRISSKNS